MIKVINRFNAGTNAEGISISRGSPLGNSFKIGDANCVSGAAIRSNEDVLQAYKDWFQAQLKLNNQAVLKSLNTIGELVLDGHDVTLICGMPDEERFGLYIKQVIEDQVHAYNNQTHS